MPGKYQRIDFVIGKPQRPKEVRSGPCVTCGRDAYREVFVSGKGWIWRHYGCDPYKPVIERRFAKGGKPIAYVPSNFEGDGVILGQKAPGSTLEPLNLKRWSERHAYRKVTL